MTDVTSNPPAVATPYPRLSPGSAVETLQQIAFALVLIAVTVACFVVATPFGVAACFLLTLGLCIARPSYAPVLIVSAFLFQNMIIAFFTPLVVSDEAFDPLRGASFVILVTAYATFLAASFQQRARAIPQLRPWLLAGIVLLGIVCFYLALGAVRGDPRDAIVYFRNTIIPIACFHIALVAASLYRVDVVRAVRWLGTAAVIYGYSELIFRLSFLALFHGDLYIKRIMVRQIATGYWEKMLDARPGFVLRGLEDVMTSTFFNIPMLSNFLPTIWRIAGPNFHPISYAYALSVISVYLLFRGRWLLPLFALPLLLTIGSKGAMVLLLFAVLTRIAMRFLSPRLTMLLLLCGAALWIAAALLFGMNSGDYHVLGLFAGLHGFLGNPLGQGLGIGGNISNTSLVVDWEQSQAAGIANVPVESAIGVMLYQMGVGAFLFFGFLAALAYRCRQLYLQTGDQIFLFGFLAIVVLSANAVLQEEAFYSPLALGLCLLLVGLALGTQWRGTIGQRSVPPTERLS
jgi:hypothetical protein